LKRPLIALKGYKYWEAILQKMLTRYGYSTYIFPRRKEENRILSKIKIVNFVYIFLNKKWFSTTNVFLIGYEGGIFLKIALLFNKKVTIFWVGSDILQLKNKCPASLNIYKDTKVRHLAISNEIRYELGIYGIEADLFEIISEQVFPKNQIPFPEKHAVLAYWTNDRMKFYGGDIVTELAKVFSEIQFFILGDNGNNSSVLPNMKYVPHIKIIDDLYKKISILIRITEHDGLPSMVLELLARGRWVICSKRLPGTVHATNFEESKNALFQILKKKEVNTIGINFVTENYSSGVLERKTKKIFINQFGEILNG
jgi:hypothetical protein